MAIRVEPFAMALAAVLVGCIELPDFPEASRVASPRVLAIVAEPPEINPGEQVTLSLVVAGAMDYTASWAACGAFDSFIGGGAQYGDDQEDDGCAERGLDLGEGKEVVLPGVFGQALFENFELATRILGGTLPEDTVRHIRDSVGLPFLIEANVVADGKAIRAVKRVLISERATPHENPPAPRLTLGEIEVEPDLTRQYGCRAAGDTSARLPRDELIEIVPATDDGEEPWLEDYQVIDARGELQDRTERAFYSWFSTGGEFDRDVTKSPLRNQIWRTPATPGSYPLWVVVRDGHGGVSACEVEVEIE
jgi:hypothetical protein